MPGKSRVSPSLEGVFGLGTDAQVDSGPTKIAELQVSRHEIGVKVR